MAEESQSVKNKNSDTINKFKKIDTVLFLVGAALIAIGSFMPWAELSSIFGKISVSGNSGDGVITAIIGFAIIIVVSLSVTLFNKNTKLKQYLPYIVYLLALGAVCTAIWDAARMPTTSSELAKISIGSGIYLIVVGGIISLASTVYSLSKTKSKNMLIATAAVFLVIVIAVGIISRTQAEEYSFGSELSSTTNATSGLFSNTQKEDSTDSNVDIQVLSKYLVKAPSYYSDYSYIRGELKNEGDNKTYIKDVTISLLSDDKVVASNEAIGTPNLIEEGEIIPFRAMINEAPEYDEIKVNVEASNSSYLDCSHLDIKSQSSRTGSNDKFFISGEVQNNSNQDYNNVTIYAWLLNSSDQVVDIEDSHINSLSSGNEKPFEIDFYQAPSYQTIKTLAETCY